MAEQKQSSSRYAPFVQDDPDLKMLTRIVIGYPPFLALLGFGCFWVYLLFFASSLKNMGAQGDPHDMPQALQSIAYFLLLSILVFPVVHSLVRTHKPQFAVKNAYAWSIWILSVILFFSFFQEVLWLID
jgi:hypothetical protein